MALRHERLTDLVKRHLRLKAQIDALSAERDKLIKEKGQIYNHLVTTADNNGRGMIGGRVLYGMIDGARCRVQAINGDVQITELDFPDFDLHSPAHETEEG